MRTRAERFGAMVSLEEPTLLAAVDRAMARRLGVEGGALWHGPEPGLDVPSLVAPTEVHVAVTERCPMGCGACYADATPRGLEPPFEVVAARLDRLAAMGVFRVALGGGEASLRADLPELVRHARAVGLLPTVTTSGIGITRERAAALADAGIAQVNVSHDGPDGAYEATRGYDGAPLAERTLQLLGEAGIPTGVNTVVTRHTLPHLEPLVDRATSLGARELQLVRLKPAGRGRMDYLAMRPTPTQVAGFATQVRRLVGRPGFAIRIDCALVPFLVAGGDLLPDDLQAFGVMGCEAGRSLWSVKADGRTSPCSFWGEGGTALGEDAWAEDDILAAFRAHARDLPAPCGACPFRHVCRGGCRVVARAVVGDPWAPDPECPRVRAHRQGKAATVAT
jgi:radical SAM protein with 4Fe4S-binding SPASM domain